MSILSDARTGFRAHIFFQSDCAVTFPCRRAHRRFAIVATSNHETRAGTTFRAFALALAAFLALPPLALAAFVIAVDPYYVFGSPSWRGFNDVRPYYEPHVLVAKPYQVRRQQPSAVALGSSRVEVGIDPRHGGWTDTNVFNFALPSSNSYAVMLAFLHAQKVGAPLKQAVVGLDFFAYNINFPLASDLSEQRFADGIAGEFATFLEGMLADPTEAPNALRQVLPFPPLRRPGTRRSISPSTRT